MFTLTWILANGQGLLYEYWSPSTCLETVVVRFPMRILTNTLIRYGSLFLLGMGEPGEVRAWPWVGAAPGADPPGEAGAAIRSLRPQGRHARDLAQRKPAPCCARQLWLWPARCRGCGQETWGHWDRHQGLPGACLWGGRCRTGTWRGEVSWHRQDQCKVCSLKNTPIQGGPEITERSIQSIFRALL